MKRVRWGVGEKTGEHKDRLMEILIVKKIAVKHDALSTPLFRTFIRDS